MTGSPTDSLQVELEVPPVVRTIDSVPITIRLRNTGDKQIQVYLAGRPIAFDISITGPGAALVWRRLEGQSIPAILRIETLLPGEMLELRDVWNQRTREGSRAAPGIYSVQGTILSDSPTPLQTPVALLRIDAR